MTLSLSCDRCGYRVAADWARCVTCRQVLPNGSHSAGSSSRRRRTRRVEKVAPAASEVSYRHHDEVIDFRPGHETSDTETVGEDPPNGRLDDAGLLNAINW